MSDRVAQSVARLSEESRNRVRNPVQPHNFMETDHEIFSTVNSPLLPIQEGQLSATRESTGIEYWLTSSGCPSLLRNSVVRLTDRPDMTLAALSGHKSNNNTTTDLFVIKVMLYNTEWKMLLI